MKRLVIPLTSMLATTVAAARLQVAQQQERTLSKSKRGILRKTCRPAITAAILFLFLWFTGLGAAQQQPQQGTTGRQQPVQPGAVRRQQQPGTVAPVGQAAPGGGRQQQRGDPTDGQSPVVSPLLSSTVGTVYRADTGQPVPGVRVRPKPLEIPNPFNKPCKAQTASDVSEGQTWVTDANGNFPLETSFSAALQTTQTPTSQTRVPQDETTQRQLELERLRRLANGRIGAVPQERVPETRIQQQLFDVITAAGTVPLAERNRISSGLIAEREGFVQAPWSDLVLLPAPTISGRVVDEYERPVAAAVVQVFRVQYGPLGRTMKWVKSTLTNDLGEYRLSWLPYGWYTIAAGYSDYVQQSWMDSLGMTPNLPQADLGLPLRFFPGVENAPDAEPIHIRPARLESPSIPAPVINIALKERPRFNVKVRLVADSMPAHANLVFVPAGGDVCTSMDYAIKANADGTFDVRDVPKGRYEMVAISGQETISALMPVNVEKNIDDFKLPVTLPSTVRGTITFEGLPPSIDPHILLGDLRVNLTRSRSEVSQVATTVPDPRTFNFSIPGLGPGFYYPTIDLPPGAFIKNIRVMRVDRPTGASEDAWTCNALPEGLYSYLDSHGHLEPLEIPKAITTQDPKELLCLRIEISFSGEIGGIAWTWTPCYPVACPLPRPLARGMAVLMPGSAWQKFSDGGVTPPDRILVIDASGGSIEFYGVPFGNYRMYAVEYPQSELIYRPEFNDWFASTAKSIMYETATPCPINAPPRTECEAFAPAQSTVDRIVQ